MEIPMIWLVVSGLFFVVGIAMNVILMYVVLELLKSVRNLEPQVAATMKSVEQVSKQVEQISSKVSHTVDTVGGGAQSLAKTANLISSSSNKHAGLISTVISTGMAIFRLYQEVESLRSARSVPKARAVDKPSKTE